MEEKLSDCCNAPAYLEGSIGDFHDDDDVCTMTYQCTKCGKPCDIKDILTKEEKKIQEKAQKFVDEYFTEEDYMKTKVTRSDWAGDKIGDVLMINGDFFDYALIKEVLRLKPTRKELTEYYNRSLELYEKGLQIVELKDYLNKPKEEKEND